MKQKQGPDPDPDPDPDPTQVGRAGPQGISLLLSKWSALQFAIQEESGGRNTRAKALKLESDLFNWFTKTTKGDVDLDDLLYDAMLQTLNVVVDDGSIEEVADKLLAMHEECFVGNYKTVERLRESASRVKPVQHVKQLSENFTIFVSNERSKLDRKIMESDDDGGGDSDSDMMSNDEEDSDDGDDDVDMMVDVPEIKSNQAPVQEAINRQPNSSNAAAPAEDDGWEVASFEAENWDDGGVCVTSIRTRIRYGGDTTI
ncbi:hypothetical protein V2J09_018538 [Rumex salicifolius]